MNTRALTWKLDLDLCVKLGPKKAVHQIKNGLENNFTPQRPVGHEQCVHNFVTISKEIAYFPTLLFPLPVGLNSGVLLVT